jgi:hypothetical protein
MASDDIDQWVDNLRKGGASSSAGADTEAALVRRLLLENQEQEAPAKTDEHAYQRLVFRLRGEGLLGNGVRAWLPTARQSMAAGVAVIGAGILFLSVMDRVGPEDPVSEVMRGDEQAQKVMVEDPRRTADAIEQLLAKKKVIMRRVAQGKTVRIQAQIGKADQAELALRLTPFGIHIPEHGRLDVVLSPRP